MSAAAAGCQRRTSVRAAGEVEKASAAERERRQGLDGAERDPGRQSDLRADAVCLEGERDGGAGDADVARSEGEDPGEIERRHDEECRDERLVDSERGGDGGDGSKAESHREPDPADDLRGGARTAAENAEDIEGMCVLAAGPRRACPPGDARRDEDSEQEKCDRPARERPTQGAEREHEREPERADGTDRGCDAADRPETSLVRERAGKEGKANRRSDPGGRQRVHDRAGAVARRSIRTRRRTAAAGQRRSPSGCGSQQRAGEGGSGNPDPQRRGVCEPFDPRADSVTEQLRSRGEHHECANRAQEQGEVTLSQREVEVHLV